MEVYKENVLRAIENCLRTSGATGVRIKDP